MTDEEHDEWIERDCRYREDRRGGQWANYGDRKSEYWAQDGDAAYDYWSSHDPR